jgi:hypothetical protein
MGVGDGCERVEVTLPGRCEERLGDLPLSRLDQRQGPGRHRVRGDERGWRAGAWPRESAP